MKVWGALLLSFVIALFVVVAAPKQVQAAESSGNITVQTKPDGQLGGKFTSRIETSWPWYLTRASGLVAAVSLVILLLSGIGQITGHTYRFLDPLTSWASHRALGIAFGVSVLVHVGALLFDHFVQFSIWQLLVPWLSDYKPVTLLGINVGSLYVALGVIALYLVAIIIITSLLWVEKKPATWKLIHLLSYVTVAFVFVHAIFLGTDLAHGWLRWTWIGLNIAVLVAVLARLMRAKTI